MYACHFCSSTFRNIFEYNRHQKVHNNLTQKIPCLHNDCNVSCKNYLTFRQHLLRFHGTVNKCMVQHCKYKANKLKLMSQHYKNHEQRFTFIVQCPYCLDKKLFKSINSYKVHLHIHHKNAKHVETVENSSEVTENIENSSEARVNTEKSSQLIYSKSNILDTEIDNSLNAPLCVSNMCINENLQSFKTSQDAAVLFSDMYLQLSSKYFVTEPIVQNIVNNIHLAFQAR